MTGAKAPHNINPPWPYTGPRRVYFCFTPAWNQFRPAMTPPSMSQMAPVTQEDWSVKRK